MYSGVCAAAALEQPPARPHPRIPAGGLGGETLAISQPMREREDDRKDPDAGRRDLFYSPEPDDFVDPDATEEISERSGFRGRRLGIFLLGMILLAAVVVAFPYIRSWRSRPVAPSGAPAQTAKSEAPAPLAPSATAGIPQVGPQSSPAPSLPPREPSRTSVPVPRTGEFWVQVGAFNVPENAWRLAARLTADRYPAEVRPGEAARLVVRVGGYPDRRQAEAIRADLAKKGFTGFVLKEKHP